MTHEEEIDIEKSKVTTSLKTLGIIIIGVVTWVGSLIGTYYKVQADVKKGYDVAIDAQNKAIEALTMSKDIQVKWNATNISLLTYRVDELTSSVKELQQTGNEIKSLIRNSNK